MVCHQINQMSFHEKPVVAAICPDMAGASRQKFFDFLPLVISQGVTAYHRVLSHSNLLKGHQVKNICALSKLGDSLLH
jgi:hypothetical protein